MSVRRWGRCSSLLVALALLAAACGGPDADVAGGSRSARVARGAHATTTHPPPAATSSSLLPTAATPAGPGVDDDPGVCPAAASCRRHSFTAWPPPRWPASADGTVVIDVAVSTTADVSALTDEQVVGAVQAAMRTWEAAVPGVRFRYTGLVDGPPVPGDGRNVVGFSPHGTGAGSTTMRGSGPGTWGEADTLLPARPEWVWEPCGGQAGPCDPIDVDRSRAGTHDVQAIVTHELGHWLSLGDLNGDASLAELTMWNAPADPLRIARFQSTLALGDVVGARRVYPCACPLPVIESP